MLTFVYFALLICGAFFAVGSMSAINENGTILNELQLLLIGVGCILCLIGLSIENLRSSMTPEKPESICK